MAKKNVVVSKNLCGQKCVFISPFRQEHILGLTIISVLHFKSSSTLFCTDQSNFQLTVTCKSLVSREFSRILLTFHFLISISRHFHFTFHSRSQGIFISLFILEMSERKTKFTFQFSKRVKAFQISLFFSRKKSEIVHVTSYFVMTNSHFW